MSKHLIALENEIGVRLVNRTGKNTPTDAGLFLYNSLVEGLRRFDAMIAECRSRDKREDTVISVWDPFVFSGAMSVFERIMYNFEAVCEEPFRFDLKNEMYMSPRQALEKGVVDIAIDYRPYGWECEVKDDGFRAFRLLEEPLIMWCNKEGELAKKETVSPDDLKGVPIMCSMRQEHPLRGSIIEMCEARGFSPTMYLFDPASAASFFFGEPKGCVYIVTQGMQGDNRFQARDDMVVRKFNDKSFAVTSYILVRDDGSGGVLSEFSDYLSTNTSR